MKLTDINIRDPFVLLYEGIYYMYGTRVGMPHPDALWGEQTGFDVYKSKDLENWSEAKSVFEFSDSFWATKQAWAPEVHYHNGKFYMLASFRSEERRRATQALVSESPEGPFKVFGEPLTPTDWECLDGTLYVENNIPYLVFCHEWSQIGDGEIAIIQLKEDLSASVGQPRILFKASESGWAEEISAYSGSKKGIVTDAPWLVKDEDKLLMFWSSFHGGCYAVGIAVSESGKLAGPWRHSEKLLFKKDGGHGMLFESLEGKRYFALHQPNGARLERPRFFEIEKLCY